ncbi:MAG: bifunctional phosphoribosylaminoimidazolecarboxamide formyltransferase/IMP cyclohydrolase [Vampirovibrio sp.]
MFSPTRYAFISVWDKTNSVELATALQERFGFGLIATGGSRQVLEAGGLQVVDLSTVTGFDEILEGRVKSLHPTVFAGILAKRDKPSHMKDVTFPIDVVVVNLYPFELGLAHVETSENPQAMVELIDIGGSSLLRAAAKNHADVAVLSSPDQYEAVLADLVAHQGQTSLGLRQRLALAAFQRSSSYDNAISGWMSSQLLKDALGEEAVEALEFPSTLNLTLHHVQSMRYGENPHQPAALFAIRPDELDYHVLQGKPLSYNNILDMEAAWNLICEFDDEPAAAIIKHTQPCGVAVAATLEQAYRRALDGDPLSAFGGVVALNQPVNEATAKAMVDIFTEVIIAPGFNEQALDVLKAKKNIRLVTRPWVTSNASQHPAERRDGLYLKQVSPNLILVQEQHFAKAEGLLARELKVISKKKPTEEQLKDAAFAWKVVKHLKSNAIVIAKDGQVVGLSGGQTSRVGAVEQALAQACDHAHGAVLASDGFFPAVDNIHAAAQNRVACIIQPAGSIKDKDVIATTNQYEMAMLATGVREFRH